jgi:hypothetical protein
MNIIYYHCGYCPPLSSIKYDNVITGSKSFDRIMELSCNTAIHTNLRCPNCIHNYNKIPNNKTCLCNAELFAIDYVNDKLLYYEFKSNINSYVMISEEPFFSNIKIHSVISVYLPPSLLDNFLSLWEQKITNDLILEGYYNTEIQDDLTPRYFEPKLSKLYYYIVNKQTMTKAARREINQ